MALATMLSRFLPRRVTSKISELLESLRRSSCASSSDCERLMLPRTDPGSDSRDSDAFLSSWKKFLWATSRAFVLPCDATSSLFTADKTRFIVSCCSQILRSSIAMLLLWSSKDVPVSIEGGGGASGEARPPRKRLRLASRGIIESYNVTTFPRSSCSAATRPVAVHC